LNMKPGLPVLKNQFLQDGLKKYAAFRQGHPLPSAEATPESIASNKQEIVRADVVEPGKPTPETGPLPQPNIATPIPITGQPTPKTFAAAAPTPIRAVATPHPQVTMITTPTPRPVAPQPQVTPLPATATPLPKMSPDGVRLEPFIAARTDPGMKNNGGSWRTYAPGQAPPARGVSLDEVGALADRGDLGERLYLRGEFRVTASGTTRAVLRDATRPDDQSPRVVVEYPAGSIPPQEKDRFTRDSARPYLISDVRRGADGVVTIYVREIINQ
jgi:hypothetical protein